MQQGSYPIRFSVDYPDRALDRVSTFFRLFAAIPILIVLSAISGSATAEWGDSSTRVIGAGGLLFAAPMFMIVVRRKYPKWWFDWNLELQRFTSRVAVYLALMDDRYPATDEQQSVHLDYPYPDVERDLNQWLPLVKWLLAIPHFFLLFFLDLALIGVVIGAWFAILFTGRYPRGLFEFAEAVLAWNNRVVGYAITLVTDVYPPFSFRA